MKPTIKAKSDFSLKKETDRIKKERPIFFWWVGVCCRAELFWYKIKVIFRLVRCDECGRRLGRKEEKKKYGLCDICLNKPNETNN